MRAKRRIEWPTIAVAGCIHAGWVALTLWHAALPGLVCLPGLAILLAWHSSLQHEVLHGHPTGWRRLNHAIGGAPLSLWLPFAIYRASHLAHHRDERLTDPLDDPETFYWTPARWRALGRCGRCLVSAQATLAGRMLIGPAWIIPRFLRDEWRRRDRARARIWAWHVVGCACVLAWLAACGFDIALYIFGCVYPASSLLLLRSFAEHRAADHAPARTAIVERAGVFGPLFLFNNLHAVHHRHPALPWYRLPGAFRHRRAAFVHARGGPVYRGYSEVAARYLFNRHDTPVHPNGRVPVPGLPGPGLPVPGLPGPGLSITRAVAGVAP